jgi:hypothetical protein
MLFPSRFLAVATVTIALLGPPWLYPLGAPREYTEQDLLARIQRENSPVKKAKYQIQLGRLKLDAAIQAYGHDDLEHGQPQLNAYLQQMQAAWDTLGKSGRQAIKKPQGFRELDIALREDGRLLNDLKHRVPYMDRGPIEKVAAEVEKLHEEVLHVLFPPLKNQTSSNYRAWRGSKTSVDSEVSA